MARKDYNPIENIVNKTAFNIFMELDKFLDIPKNEKGEEVLDTAYLIVPYKEWAKLKEKYGV